MTDKRQKATKAKCKRDESLTKQPIFVEYSLLLKKHLSLGGAHSQMITIPKSTRRNVKLNKFTFETPWLPDYYINIDLRHQYGISVAES